MCTVDIAQLQSYLFVCLSPACSLSSLETITDSFGEVCPNGQRLPFSYGCVSLESHLHDFAGNMRRSYILRQKSFSVPFIDKTQSNGELLRVNDESSESVNGCNLTDRFGSRKDTFLPGEGSSAWAVRIEAERISLAVSFSYPFVRVCWTFWIDLSSGATGERDANNVLSLLQIGGLKSVADRPYPSSPGSRRKKVEKEVGAMIAK